MADHPRRAGVHTDMINRGRPVPMVAPMAFHLRSTRSAASSDSKPRLENMNADDAAFSAAETLEENRNPREQTQEICRPKAASGAALRGRSICIGRKAGKIRAQFYPSPARASSPFRRETRDRCGFSETAALDSEPGRSRGRTGLGDGPKRWRLGPGQNRANQGVE